MAVYVISKLPVNSRLLAVKFSGSQVILGFDYMGVSANSHIQESTVVNPTLASPFVMVGLHGNGYSLFLTSTFISSVYSAFMCTVGRVYPVGSIVPICFPAYKST